MLDRAISFLVKASSGMTLANYEEFAKLIGLLKELFDGSQLMAYVFDKDQVRH